MSPELLMSPELHPGFGMAVLAIGGTATLVLMFSFLKGRAAITFWVVACALSGFQILADGHDILHHAFRTSVVYSALAGGTPDLMVTLQDTTLPIFYYYSTLSYSFAASLMALGLSAILAIKIIAAISFVVMAVGVLKLFRRSVAAGVANSDAAYLIATIFLCANYVHMNYSVRTAIPEALAYAFIPVVVIALLDRRWGPALLAIAFQIMAHPVVFPQCFVAVLALLFALGHEPWRDWRSLLAVFAGAMILASPFWLPGLLDAESIRGADALPIELEDTFLTIGQIFDPIEFRGLGPWLPLTLVLAMWVSWRNATWRAAVAGIAFAATLAIQLEIARPLMVQIPLLDLSLFVFRWMFVAALLGSTMVALLWSRSLNGRVGMTLATLAGLNAIAVSVYLTLPSASSLIKTDEEIVAAYEIKSDSPSWGLAEFLPDYSELDNACALAGRGDAIRLTYSQLRDGPVKSTGPLIIPNAPIGVVHYLQNGRRVEDIASCADALVVPIEGPDALVEVREATLFRFPIIKFFLPAVVLLALVALTRKRRPRDLQPLH